MAHVVQDPGKNLSTGRSTVAVANFGMVEAYKRQVPYNLSVASKEGVAEKRIHHVHAADIETL